MKRNRIFHVIACVMLLCLCGAAWSQTAPARLRLALTGSVAPDGLGKPALTRGDNADLQVCLQNADGTLVDVSTLVDLTLELYASSESTTQISTPITLTAADFDDTLTLPEWTDGSGQHATFELGTLQTNVVMSSRQLTCWGVIYGTLADGGRRTFGAGTINLRNGNAGGEPPADVLDPLYPTLAEITAFTSQVNVLGDAVEDEAITRADSDTDLQADIAAEAATRAAADTALAGQLAAGATYYVDNAAANDSASGLLSTAPKKTIASALALAGPGGTVKLRRNGVWRETVDLTALGSIALEDYGAGDRPIIDGSQIVTTWTLESGIVWRCSVTLEAGAATRCYPYVFENDVRLNEVVDGDAANLAARIALVQATPGSFYFAGPGNYTSGWTAGSKTVYISASDSGNPNSNGKTYCTNARSYALTAADARLKNIHVRRMTHHDGLTMGAARGGVLDGVYVSDYGRHGIIDPHSVHKDCRVWGGNPRFAGGCYHFYKATLDESDARYSGCVAVGVSWQGAPQGTGWYGHGSNPGVTRNGDQVIIENCQAWNLSIGYGSADVNRVYVQRCQAEGCGTDVSAGCFVSYNVADCQFRGAGLASVAVAAAGRTTNIEHCRIATAITNDNAAMIWNAGAAGAINLSGSELYNSGQRQPNVRQPVRIVGALDSIRIRNSAIMAENGSFDNILSAASVDAYDIPDDELVTSLPLNFKVGGSSVAASTLCGRIQRLRSGRFYQGSPLVSDWGRRPGTAWPPASGFNTITYNKGSGSFLEFILGGKTMASLETTLTNPLAGASYYTPAGELFGSMTIAASHTFLQAGAGGILYKSTSMTSGWGAVSSGTANALRAGASKTGVAVLVGDTGTIRRSTDDGATWAGAATPGTSSTLRAAAFGASVFVAAGDGGTIVSSTDGDTWTSRTSSTTNPLRAAAFGASLFVVVGDAGTIRTSPDGTTWTSRTSNTVRHFVAVDFGGSRFTAVCQDNTAQPGDIFTSTDGITWTPVVYELPFEPTCVLYGGSTGSENWWVIAGRSRSIAISYDGLTWRPHQILQPDVAKLAGGQALVPALTIK